MFLVSITFSLSGLYAADLLQIREGDRILLIGSTMIEREQSYGYWETALYAAKPEVEFSLRNLGWSGDTVWSESRAGFETPEYGFKELQKLVETLQPTLIVVNYGFNESFAGERGLAKFKDGLKRLTEMLSATKARIVLVSPTRMEYRMGKFPDHRADNRNVELYRDAIRDFAAEHHLGFGDWTDSVVAPSGPVPLSEDLALTDNGLHLTQVGFWKTSESLAELAGVPPSDGHLSINLANLKIEGFLDANDLHWKNDELTFTGISKRLPLPSDPRSGHFTPYTFSVVGLNPLSTYNLRIGDRSTATATGAMWASGVEILKHPDFDQVENLKNAILRKNELFFHRWRPQNVTYLFGFRKHEQGQNAKEVAEFEPLVQEQGKLIDELKRPRAYEYRFVPTETPK